MSARNVLYRICNKVNFMYKSANRQFISVNLPIHIPIHSLSTQTQFVSPEYLSDDFLYIIFRKTWNYYIKQRKYGQLCCLKYDWNFILLMTIFCRRHTRSDIIIWWIKIFIVPKRYVYSGLVFFWVFLRLLMVPYLCIKIRTEYSIRCCKFMTSLNHRTI